MRKILKKHKMIVRSKNGKQTSGSTLIDGPFEGLDLPHVSPGANARYMYVELIDAFLFTHPHMDHIAGAVVNTAVNGLTRQKRYAGLPTTIEGLKNHVFNGVIWPNLTDENNGAGMVSYVRLVEGGSPASGEGDSKGYVEVVPGLGVKALGISHGTCMERHPRRGSTPLPSPSHGDNQHLGSPFPNTRMARSDSNASTFDPSVPRLSLSTQTIQCVYNSTAFFIRDTNSGREIIIFGDVEPDSISMLPRNENVWALAAPKIASGHLTAIFIECSYDDSREDDQLFGHMTPSHLMVELKKLADMVARNSDNELRSKAMSPKRKRASNGNNPTPTTKSLRQVSPVRSDSPGRQTVFRSPPKFDQNFARPGRRSAYSGPSKAQAGSKPPSDKAADKSPRPLEGVKIVIAHIKNELDDERDAPDIIRKQLLDLEREAGLGCEFIVSHSGQALYF
ncbi:3',5'-cyclic-nucleotide phosphodiesterase pde1, variant 2 [Cadophora gregata]|nr:3',5'-cyclic-nucleotide phosphodiesterase pde1, variant 2 [Cadophora gregata]KAK0124452.1 3',5'-cyclic-nucleotide phosphodiesterase pde1, variant 2 [Cadophora gregata]